MTRTATPAATTLGPGENHLSFIALTVDADGEETYTRPGFATSRDALTDAQAATVNTGGHPAVNMVTMADWEEWAANGADYIPGTRVVCLTKV